MTCEGPVPGGFACLELGSSELPDAIDSSTALLVSLPLWNGLKIFEIGPVREGDEEGIP